MFCVEDELDHLAGLAAPTGAAAAAPGTLACVLFTSGSSGHPKAVEIADDSLLVYLDALAATLPVTAVDVYLHTASLSFSAAIRQLFFPLSLGATVLLADSRQRQDPIELLSLMRAHGATVWDTVPTSWQVCIDALRALGADRSAALLDNRVRLIASTGEALPWRTVDDWRTPLRHAAEIWNLYSQTETCGTVCAYRVPIEGPRAAPFVPLGRPLPHTDVSVRDDDLQPVADGIAGEICVGGARLARGYRGAPALTADRFVGDRLVRTGDLGVRRADGTFEWTGRKDRQIKLRGFRIQPAEVEETLRAHPHVRQASVGVRAHAPGDPRTELLAHVVTDASVTAGELRAFLSERLPAYMVPKTLSFVRALPTTASGKVARPVFPTRGQPASRPTAIAGNALDEAALLAIWRELLESDAIGLDDDFFATGGDSLLAVQLMIRLEASTERRLGVESLLHAPTVRELALLLAQPADARSGSISPLQTQGERMPFFCIHGLTGDILWYAELARRCAPDQPFYGIKAPALEEGTPATAIVGSTTTR